MMKFLNFGMLTSAQFESANSPYTNDDDGRGGGGNHNNDKDNNLVL